MATYEMAVVVGVATVVTQETHRVALDDVLGVILHELLRAVPEGGDGLDVFVEAEHEAVLLLILGHEAEGVVVDVAEELDARLDAPVPLVVHHQWLAEEEAGLEAAHVAVADGVAVDDLALGHVLADLLRLVLVDEIREGPVLLGDLAVVRLSGDEGARDLLEGAVEGLVVQEHPVVVVSAVEAVLDLADGLGDLPDVAVAGERDKGGIHARAGGDAHEIVPSRIVGCEGHRGLGEIFELLSRARRRTAATGIAAAATAAAPAGATTSLARDIICTAPVA